MKNTSKILAGTLLGILGACGGTDTNPNPPPGGVQPTFTSLYGDYFQNCKNCHAPGAPGRTSLTEMSLDFTSQSTAYNVLTTGHATGLQGNQADCNGAAFVVPGMPNSSLVVAVLDAAVRGAFDVASAPKCDMNAVSDMTVKVGMPPSGDFLAALKTWITNMAPNN